MASADFFVCPALVAGAEVTLHDGVVEVRRGPRSAKLKALPENWVHPVFEWLRQASIGDQKLTTLSQGDPWRQPILAVLDSGGLVVEHGSSQDRSGRAVLSRIEQQLWAHIERREASGKIDAILLGALSERQLIGNAFEYYFITLGAYDAVAPAISRLHGRLQALIGTFILEEYRHDQILLRALAVYGYKEADLANVVPLPFTSAITSQLFYLSHTDPLSLIACLFVAEGRPESGERYIAALERMRVPQDYLESHREHDRINTTGGHGFISRRCYAEVDYVSAEDEERISSRVLMFSDLAAARVAQMINYYGDERNPCPRKSILLQTSGA